MKKLTVNDIPVSCDYAAVNAQGFAFGYKKIKPVITNYDSWSNSNKSIRDSSVFIGSGYDASDWKNSLLKREDKVVEDKSKLINVTFVFEQKSNKLSYCDSEKITIDVDYSGGGSFILKTDGWTIKNEDDIKKLIKQIKINL
jgi:hypothetical protein